MWKKLVAFLFGHGKQIEAIAERAYKELGRDILRVSEAERRERIVSAVKAVIDGEFPEYARYTDWAIDLVVERVRAALRARAQVREVRRGNR